MTGGDLSTIGGRTYLVFGQDFQGGYALGANPTAPPSFTQIYSDEIRSFRIVATGKTLAIKGYQALRDPTNFRRRDGNMGNVITRSGQPGFTYYGGVFTPGNNAAAYQAPIVINATARSGSMRVTSSFLTSTRPRISPMYNAKSRAMIAVFMGGIGIYDYDYPDGPLTNLTVRRELARPGSTT